MPTAFILSDRSRVVINDEEGLIQIEDEQRYELGVLLRAMLSEARKEIRFLMAQPNE